MLVWASALPIALNALFLPLLLYILLCFIRSSSIRSLFFKKVTVFGPILLVLTCLFWCLLNLVSFSFNFIHQGKTFIWCQFDGIGITLFCGSNFSIQTVLALERYVVIVYEKPLQPKWILLIFVGCYVYMLGLILAQMVWSPSYFVPLEGNVWCFYHFTSTYLVDQCVNVAVILFCILVSTILLLFYGSIYIKVRQHRKETLALHSNDKTPSEMTSYMESSASTQTGITTSTTVRVSLVLAPRKMDPVVELERRVFIRCAMLLGGFLACFGPIFITFIYKVVTHQSLATSVHLLATCWGELDILVTPLLVIHMNPEFKKAVFMK